MKLHRYDEKKEETTTVSDCTLEYVERDAKEFATLYFSDGFYLVLQEKEIEQIQKHINL